MGFFSGVVSKVTSFVKSVFSATKSAVSAAEKAIATGLSKDVNNAINKIDNAINEIDKLQEELKKKAKKLKQKITTGALASEISQSIDEEIEGIKNDILSGKATDIIIKGGKDFIIGAGQSIDNNLLFGTAFSTAGVSEGSLPNSMSYKAGKVVGDILSLIASGGEMAAGGGMEAGGFVLDSTGALAPVGVMANAGGLVVAGDGLINARRSSNSLAEDLFSFASNGQGGNPRSRLPKSKGRWQGERGNGKWYSDKSEANKITGGDPVEFTNGRPNFTPWSKGSLKFKPGQLKGTQEDFDLVYEKLKEIKKFKSKNEAQNWLREKGLTPHHKDGTTIELIPTDLHGNVPHIGSASDLRGGY
ncbi:HNH endonuclease [Clostridium thailandense]|uniref:HNH endonuclease n=1 Tax=Clostridium thailandense TaxID=2794346 RepID=UPI00398A2B95